MRREPAPADDIHDADAVGILVRRKHIHGQGDAELAAIDNVLLPRERRIVGGASATGYRHRQNKRQDSTKDNLHDALHSPGPWPSVGAGNFKVNHPMPGSRSLQRVSPAPRDAVSLTDRRAWPSLGMIKEAAPSRILCPT